MPLRNPSNDALHMRWSQAGRIGAYSVCDAVGRRRADNGSAINSAYEAWIGYVSEAPGLALYLKPPISSLCDIEIAANGRTYWGRGRNVLVNQETGCLLIGDEVIGDCSENWCRAVIDEFAAFQDTSGIVPECIRVTSPVLNGTKVFVLQAGDVSHALFFHHHVES